ncbi:MAG: hypothetical protein WCV73_00435 [Patescibacteria group bacterium]|jgi:hypothetical protein
MPERLLKQFKKLETISPSSKWTENARSFLLKKIETETIALEPTWSNKFYLSFVIWSGKLMPSPVKMTALVTLVAVMFGTNLVAQAEIPPVGAMGLLDRTAEKINILLAFTPKDEINVHLFYAEKREAQLGHIANDNEISAEEKVQHINKIVKYLEGNIAGAANSLAIAKEDSGQDQQEKSEVTQLALQITQNGQEAVKSLEQIKVSVPTQDVNKTVSEAQSVIEATGVASLEVAVNQIQNQPIEGQSGAADQVKDVLSEVINHAQENINQLGAQAEQVGLADSLATKKDDPKKVEVKALNKELTDAVENSGKAQVILDEAKGLLNNDNLTGALEKVKASNVIAKQSKDIVSKIGDISVINDALLQSATTSSSTINLLKVGAPKVPTVNVKDSTSSLETTLPIINPKGVKVNPSLIFSEQPTSSTLTLPFLED